MDEDRRLKRAQFLISGAALGLAACSNGGVSQITPLTSLGKRAAKRGLKNKATGPAALLQGYNSVLGNACSTALTGTSSTVGGASSVTCRVCTSASEIASALEIDASLSVAYGPLGSVDVKTKYLSSLNVTTYSITMVVYAKHLDGKELFTDVGLKPGVAVPSTAADTDSFVSTYGDSWISEISRGGEYFATYTFFSQTKEEQQQIEASMNASGIINGVQIDAGFQAKVSNFVKTSQVTYAFNQSITGLRNPSLPEPTDFIAYALKFPSIPLDSPAIIGFASNGYETVPGMNTEWFKKVASNRRYFIVGTASQPGGLGSSLATIANIKNQIGDVGAIYKYYGYTGDSLLESRRMTANNDFDTVVAQMQSFETAATSSFTVPSLPSIANGTPALDYGVGSSSEYGGNGGNPFNDVDIHTYLQKRTRITKLELWGGAYVDQIVTSYYEEATHHSWVAKHGGNGGNAANPLQLLPGQTVVGIRVRGDALVDRLRIGISDGRSIVAGGNGGYDHSPWIAPAGSVVLGFRGRAGAYIDKIGVDYAVIKPAKWSAVP